MKIIHVVAGVLFGWAGNEDAVLLGKRRTGKLRPGLWEMPGGKVEPNESAAWALTREWQEELQLEIGVHDLISRAVIDVEDLFVVDLFLVSIRPGTGVDLAKPIDHSELRWVAPREAVMNYPCSPAMYQHYAPLLRWMEARNAKG